MAYEYFTNNAITQLSQSIDSSETNLRPANPSAFPSQSMFRIRVGNELMMVNSVAVFNMTETVWIVSRGIEGTASTAHNSGTSIRAVITAEAVEALNGMPKAGTSGQLLAKSGSDDYDTAWTEKLQYAASGSILSVASGATTDKPLVLKAVAGQTANLVELQANNGDVLATISATGSFQASNGSSSATAYGFASNSAVGLFYAYQELYLRCGFSKQYRIGNGQIQIQDNGGSLRLGDADGYASLRINGSYGNGLEVTSGANYGDPLGPVLCGAGFSGQIGLQVRASSNQSANLVEWQSETGTSLGAVTKNGGIRPATMKDNEAENNTIYYSTNSDKLVFKDPGGTINELY